MVVAVHVASQLLIPGAWEFGVGRTQWYQGVFTHVSKGSPWDTGLLALVTPLCVSRDCVMAAFWGRRVEGLSDLLF